jgi:hypothetical protein
MKNVPDAKTQTRFWRKINKTEGCWYFTAGKTHDGYGQFWDGRKNQYVHRFSYKWFVGPIPVGFQLDHKCHEPGVCNKGKLCVHRACVNPAHLEPVTSRGNTLRGNAASALNAAKTHCPKGHEYTKDNTYRHGGHRACRSCNLVLMRQYYERHKEEAKARRRRSYARKAHGLV